jgi:hypothetical protein
MCTCGSHRQKFLFGLPTPGSTRRCLAGELPMPRRNWLAAAGSAAALLWGAPSLVAAKLYGKPVQYDFVSSGVVKGSQTTVVMPDGTYDVQFEYTDRGRGPKLRSLITLDSSGFISTLQTTGYNYLKVPVAERFVARNGVVSWKNAIENEHAKSLTPRFYISVDGSPEEAAIIARAALNTSNRTIPLWPEGEASVRSVQVLVATSGEQSRRVTMYELLGLDFSPVAIWLDEDGALFMSGSQWGAVIPVGWKESLPKLLAAQDARTAELGRELASTLPQRSATAIAITNVSLFDSERGVLVPNSTVVLHGDTVVAVGGSDVNVPSDARRIDGSGKTLLPGLWDMHHHLQAEFGPRILAQGVTTIRDPGNDPVYISRTQKQFESGELLGPRVIIAGLMDGTGQYTAPIGTTTSTVAEAISQVHDWKNRGAVQIKIYSSMNPQLVPVIAKEAHSLGMRVSGHIPAGMIAEDAVHAGYDEIQHVNFLFLNFMPDTKDRTQTPLRLTAAAERAGTIDLQSQPVRDFIALLKERDIVSDPTLVIFNSEASTRPGNVASTGFAEIADWLPPQIRRGLTTGGLPQSPELVQKYDASVKAFSAMVKLLHDNGIRYVAGTDDILPGFDLIRELELYSEAGIPNAAALQAATIQPARVMRMDDKLGSLTVGKFADAILVYGNPLDDMTQLRRVGTTIKGGVLYNTRALYATASVKAPPLA